MPETMTAGRAAIRALLPKEYHNFETLDKKTIRRIFDRLAKDHPEQYAETLKQLTRFGQYAAESTGQSLSLESVRQPKKVRKAIADLKAQLDIIESNPALSEKERSDARIALVSKRMPKIRDMLFDEALKNNNPLAKQVLSGSRGNKTQLQQIIVGDGLVKDHRGRVLDIPILHGYAQGLDPVEYWAGGYGARHGTATANLLTADTGYLSKLLNQATHRLVVTEDDCGTTAGIPVKANDPDNVGSVLAIGAGRYSAGTLLDGDQVKKLGDKTIYVRSPATCRAAQGVCRKCAGARSSGDLPEIGDVIGLPSAQAIGEKITQAALSAKHQGGVATKAEHSRPTGFNHLRELVSMGTTMHYAAPVAEADGTITAVREAPQGGMFVVIGDKQYHVPIGQKVLYKVGQTVEAGDPLSDGVPNPALLVKYKGLGEGRRRFIDLLSQALRDANAPLHRRNIEALARGLINHVKITAPDGYAGYLPDDIVPYDRIANVYSPRDGSQDIDIAKAKNYYLERPYLHYTTGTRITPSVIKTLSQNNIKRVTVNKDEPPFEPVPVRIDASAMRDTNWLTRLSGTHLEQSLTEAVHRSRSAPLKGETSYVPSLSDPADFGKMLKTKGTF